MAKKNLKYSAEKIDELLTKADEQMATKSDLTKKVDKVDGKGLSTNDYTTAEKAKLAGIQEGAQKNTVTSVRGALQLNPQVGNVVISAADIGLGDANARLTSLENNKLNKSEKGATNGVASLDENGRVPSSQLPSYVDDVIEMANYESLPTSGESGKIYITQSDNKTYRWSGNGYAEVSASLALGETEQSAYSGAKGKKNAEDIAKLAHDLDATHQLASNAESAISEVVELTIPAIEGELENKLGKTEKAADSAKADVANNSILLDGKYGYQYGRNLLNEEVDIDTMTNGVYGGKLFNASHSLVDFPANADGYGAFLSAAYGKYGIQFIGRHDGYLYVRVNDNAVRPWSQIAFTDSTVANATNAESLSGKSLIYRWTGTNSGVPYIETNGVMEFGRIIDFHIASEPSGTDFATQLRCQETVTGVQVYLPSKSGTLALTTDNVASATKLATPRKIWGQSFDGSGNIDGDMEVNGDVVIKGNVVIEGNITSGASYQSNSLSTISEDEVPSVEQQLRAQIATLEERIAALEQLIAQNNG